MFGDASLSTPRWCQPSLVVFHQTFPHLEYVKAESVGREQLDDAFAESDKATMQIYVFMSIFLNHKLT